jgi:uncharacterized protein YhfF
MDDLDGLPPLELAFPGPERDRGVAAVLSGDKTAFTGLLEIHEKAGEPVPAPGDRFAVLDSAGRPAAAIELTEVRVVPIADIDDAYAHAEGRGYAGAAEWRADHERFFRGAGVTEFLGHEAEITDATPVVAQRFRRLDP